MTHPILFPQAKVSDAVRDEEASIIEAEGSYHVNGVYYACSSDAALRRRWEAERRVADAEQKELERIARKCAWCERRFKDGEARIDVGLRNEVHTEGCLAEFDFFVQPARVAAPERIRRYA